MRLAAPRFATLATALFVGLAACAPDGAPSGLTRALDILENRPIVPVVQSAAVVPGDSVAVIFRSTVDFELWFNPCDRFVERREGDGWTRLPDELRLCNGVAYILRPNVDRQEYVDAPLDLTRGTFRFVFAVRRPNSADVIHWAASTSFVVR